MLSRSDGPGDAIAIHMLRENDVARSAGTKDSDL